MRAMLERWLNAVWYENAPTGWVLIPLGWLYQLVVYARRLMYRLGIRHTHKAGVPVIIVGNITAGGVGKTPLVIWLIEWLRQRGCSPGIVTRGYGGAISESTLVDASHTATDVGDEALMMSRRLSVPVVVGARRMTSAVMLEEQGVDIIVADDGLQHYALERDVEICVYDEQRQFGNRRLLPAGPLRESLSRLASVDIMVCHRSTLDGFDGSMAVGSQRLRRLIDGTIQTMDSMAGITVHAVAGIGHPTRFFDSLSNAGMNVVPHPFGDHHTFAQHDLEFGDDHPILMTEKDAVKCERFAHDRMYAVVVDAQVSGDIEQAIIERLKTGHDVFAD